VETQVFLNLIVSKIQCTSDQIFHTMHQNVRLGSLYIPNICKAYFNCQSNDKDTSSTQLIH